MGIKYVTKNIYQKDKAGVQQSLIREVLPKDVSDEQGTGEQKGQNQHEQGMR